MANDIISEGDTVKVSEDYPVREFAGQEGTVIQLTGSAVIIDCDAIEGEMIVFRNHVELASIHTGAES